MVERIIICGMYSFTDELKLAWQQLFEILMELLDGGDRKISLRFDADQSLLLNPALLFGHTCGYPLMIHLQDRVSPFCVPVFDVPGSEGKFYSSRFIVGAQSVIASLADCRGKIAAINAPDSNSGMNVLRHAISDLDPAGQFFSRVITTGGHLHSLEAVANRQADIAAIDCVSYAICRHYRPRVAERLRVIAYSTSMPGLPYVTSKDRSPDSVARLKTGLASAFADPKLADVRSSLFLEGLEFTDRATYDRITALESKVFESPYYDLG